MLSTDPESEDGLSDVAHYFIGGLLKHVKSIAVYSNPTVNSYKRLVPGYEAPTYIVWSASNRSCLVRIPAARGMGTRVELRCPDPTCSPYLEMALCLAAGLDGIKNKRNHSCSWQLIITDLTFQMKNLQQKVLIAFLVHLKKQLKLQKLAHLSRSSPLVSKNPIFTVVPPTSTPNPYFFNS